MVLEATIAPSRARTNLEAGQYHTPPGFEDGVSALLSHTGRALAQHDPDNDFAGHRAVCHVFRTAIGRILPAAASV